MESVVSGKPVPARRPARSRAWTRSRSACRVPTSSSPPTSPRAAGDIMVLGAGGKMGPTLARMARRAAPERAVDAVARFSDPAAEDGLREHGVETIAADLLERDRARSPAARPERRLHGRAEVRHVGLPRPDVGA